jgi:uncharacterized phage protein gp47/JayE
MSETSERQFPVFEVGELRDELLAYFRNGLRQMVNPDTGLPFTEEEIAFATSEPTNWWAKANALDVVLLALQSRGLWTTDQIWPDRAASTWLRERHAPLRGLAPLPASGGAGRATGNAPAGSVFVGSTTIPDAAAHYALDDKGKRYQVVFTETVPGTGKVTLDLKAIDTGRDTNLLANSRLRWGRAPLGAEDFAVDAQFKGGSPAETDQELGRRIADAIRYKQTSANRARLRALARQADPAVADAFIYSAAYHAGSVHVALLGKRDSVLGPSALIPAAGTVAVVRAAIVPPGSREVPGQPVVVVTAPIPVSRDFGLEIDTLFADGTPWPQPSVADVLPQIQAVASQTSFTLRTASRVALPSATPALMVWDEANSAFEALKVASVVFLSGSDYTVTLTDAPETTLAVGMFISPSLPAARRGQLEDSLEAYFDALGPGQLVDDERLGRAYRFPDASVAWPAAFSETELASTMKETMGPAIGQLGIRVIEIGSPPALPAVPVNPTLGPTKFILGAVGVYPRTP